MTRSGKRLETNTPVVAVAFGLGTILHGHRAAYLAFPGEQVTFLDNIIMESDEEGAVKVAGDRDSDGKLIVDLACHAYVLLAWNVRRRKPALPQPAGKDI
jgi:hypothetical protein